MEPKPELSPHHAYPDHWEADVVLRDGGTARIRPITTDDAERLVSFYEQVSDESKYYRFFAPYPRLSDRDVHRFTHHDYVDRVGLAVTIGGEFIGTVRYDRINEQGRPASAPADEAEVAFLVQDAHQGRGVASALLEHIAAVARERGIRRFAAEVLPANNKMIKVFRDAGYTQRRSFEDGSVHLTLDLEPTEKSLAVQRGREQRAEARSVQRLLAPGSVAVIGTGRTPGGVGRTVLRNLLAAGFTGRAYAVNRAFDEGLATLDGVPAHRSLGEIDEQVDLAVIAVPAHRVPEAVADCGEHGVQGLVVLSAGYAERGSAGRELQRELVRQARSYGMRIIGPNAFGIINTAESVRLNASLAPESPARGRIGLFTQSGAIGIALLSGLHRRGAGLSSFISAGNRADVSGNDFLQYSFEDPDTDVALLYLESLGNPRKFTRLARRTAALKPVVVVKGARHSGTNPPGHAVPVSRIPDATVSALMRQAGVIRVDTVTEMVDAGLLLAGQPLPAGPRVAILGNSESLGLLTYDACLAEGLRPRPPIDLTTAASPQDFKDALAEALADGTCDAVIVTAIPWVGENGEAETGDGEVLAAALHGAAAKSPAKPVAVVHVEIGGLAEALAAASSTAAPRTRPTTLAAQPHGPSGAPAPTETAPREAGEAEGAEAPARPGRIPAYPAAERAVRAMAEAVKYAQWRRQAATPGKVPEFLDETTDEPGTAALIDTLLGATPDPRGRSLSHDEARELLGRYGIPVRPTLPAPDPGAAVAAAARLGYPVALKTTAPHLRHRADLGGVRLDLADEDALRRAYGEFTELLGRPAELLPVVQSMAPRGVDTVLRASIDAAAGAVLSFGLAGAPSELLGDTAHRLVPVTDRDAAELIRSIKAAPVLFGWRGSAPVDTPALEELLLRLSRLVDDHPEVVSVALEPVVVAPQGLTVLGASVRLAPPPPRGDLGPRRLPNY
ncbi:MULTISPECIES: bifunctional acetate--CoA ligase family protein/GNAT family N-acetyltransferase [unclassified Streptomyces]|uniref:bifunctional acetate--CoA ligase family protein/GNAT family N-acetyltransferase n=1 Tax=unclassified Streptomyces TaxID=2593676 RepID=UPI00081F71C3|nr:MULTISPECIES: bifunctional GNAT family N-acetyltransferase/acetate--CoA ligase family protein [unclassified Streptomyces]MYR96066.1 GNAT family N-acetyltransferase [Streptomyces sp. SID4937]SCE02495.1 Acyl-CoA synthetase (NDP forming) [Streptomyces sp. ScaeMP-e83]